MDNPIRFVDIAAGETDEDNRITRRLAELTGILRDSSLDIPTDDQIRQDIADGKVSLAALEGESPLQVEYEGLRMRKLLNADDGHALDRVFYGVATDVGSAPAPDGLFPSQRPPEPFGVDLLFSEELEAAARYGILTRDGAKPNTALADPGDTADRRFATALANSRAEYRANQALYLAVLRLLVEAGQGAGRVGDTTTDDVNATDWATITKTLIADGTPPGDMYLPVKVQAALGNVTAGGDSVAASSIDIDLPSLDDDATVAIVQDNLKADAGDLLLVDARGAAPVPGGGQARRALQRRRASVRQGHGRRPALRLLAQVERALHGGRAAQPVRALLRLPRRRADAVAEPGVQRPLAPVRLGGLVVLPAGHGRQPAARHDPRTDHSGGPAQGGSRPRREPVAATATASRTSPRRSLQEQIKDVIEILQSDDVKSAYGSRDMWQVVDQVATLELGGARNTVRYRTMAQSGATIIRWLGAHASELSSFGNVIDETEIRRNIKSPSPMSDPTDRDLVDACEQWLAVTGTPDQQVQQYSQPVEAPNSTSVPIQIPQAAKDLLDSVGVSAGVNGR